MISPIALKRWVAPLLCLLSFGAEAQEPVIPVQLVAVNYTTLSAELPAKIDRITVKEGERFKEGQQLVAFDCTIQRALVDEASAVFAAAEKSKAVYKRLLELNSTGTLEAEKSGWDAAVAQAKLNSARAVASKCGISAPFAGRVVEQKARAHQYVQVGQAILEILDDSVLNAEFIVPSSAVTTLKPGTSLQIMVDETRKTYPGRIARMGAKVDAVSHSVKITAEIKGDFPELMAGMTGKISMAPQ
ncbi:putative HlyD family secretion protein [Magnetospirillum gryphiswaldense MSR-1 v2]|uniref:HlyD family secretion protein n=2 Tax=Magnetospirillum gryphiswaldense TaxID=55518 RepID=V6F5P6_MAGGM|nr:efflux RND transporter periplasmic adaptor subunit [Magnetospirillum gryphiswaldense]CAM78249.1 Membrane-fusion protein [Magnetospirillum gryphiswaldense MSR-1]CDK99145.1 putative HlyD family secretion protein [Magnetospirillum gryphiswaldense MSR-1 v2]CDK99651.1 putative HlyD family secretion protein [Magnetospirillum gryphiswaldense MSR-1 v2]